MNSLLNNIESTIISECIKAAEVGFIVDSNFEYSNILDDIKVSVKGIMYGDDITFRRGSITDIEVTSKVHILKEEDIEEFKNNIKDKFSDYANKI